VKNGVAFQSIVANRLIVLREFILDTALGVTNVWVSPQTC
jgi:hypothetical protein